MDSDEDIEVKMDKVLEHFKQYCEPCKNTIYERYLFFSRGQESGKPIDKYATVLRNMADSFERFIHVTASCLESLITT